MTAAFHALKYQQQLKDVRKFDRSFFILVGCTSTYLLPWIPLMKRRN